MAQVFIKLIFCNKWKETKFFTINEMTKPFALVFECPCSQRNFHLSMIYDLFLRRSSSNYRDFPDSQNTQICQIISYPSFLYFRENHRKHVPEISIFWHIATDRQNDWNIGIAIWENINGTPLQSTI